MGPIEVVVISFPDQGLMSGIAPLLERVMSHGSLRVVDAVIATTGRDGVVSVTDLEDEIVPRWSSISPDPRPLLSGADAEMVSARLGAHSTALLLAIEHRWITSIEHTVSDLGGALELHARINPSTVAAASLIDS